MAPSGALIVTRHVTDCVAVPLNVVVVEPGVTSLRLRAGR